MKKPQHLAALACLLLQRRTTELSRSGAQPKGPYPNPSASESEPITREAGSLSVPNSREVV